MTVLIELEVVIEKADGNIRTKVFLNSGTVKIKKGVNVPHVSHESFLVSLKRPRKRYISVASTKLISSQLHSYVKQIDVLEIRELLEEHNAQYIQIVPKIETKRVSTTSIQS